MSAKQKQALGLVAKLRNTFIRNTVPANISAFKLDLAERIDKYNRSELETDPAKEEVEQELVGADQLKPVFSNLCLDMETYIGKATDAQADKYAHAISEYLILKEKTRTEFQIMEANRVGSEKNFASILKNTASHVGLKMPQEYDHSKQQ